ncbi:unnamed protein product [Spirodela intermedia]|uniref:Uncharacterized protein n=1 Tax=Spirodela intermedia TaxID=51605 RepID=A0A7I8JTP9_SPIIN|nr:unnamed protein product [Spirodela intermedia]CAA6673548.1 unnamed protein product [Spirodela intermedia]
MIYSFLYLTLHREHHFRSSLRHLVLIE